MSGNMQPVVYARPGRLRYSSTDQFESLLGALTALVEAGPTETFESASVRVSVWHLSQRLAERAAEGGGFDTPDVWEAKRSRSLAAEAAG